MDISSFSITKNKNHNLVKNTHLKIQIQTLIILRSYRNINRFNFLLCSLNCYSNHFLGMRAFNRFKLKHLSLNVRMKMMKMELETSFIFPTFLFSNYYQHLTISLPINLKFMHMILLKLILKQAKIK